MNALAHHHLKDIDEFTRRLGNAIRMLSEADKSESDAIALVLCFAAIEAIVWTKQVDDDDWGIEKQIRKLVPALLRPNPTGRRGPENVLHDLYYTRCQTAHQGRSTAHPLELHDVRQVAAGVLRAAIEWRNARSSKDEPSNWETFTQVLVHSAKEKCAMSDVPDLSELLPGKQRGRLYQR